MKNCFFLLSLIGAAIAAAPIYIDRLYAQESRLWQLVERYDNPDPFFADCDCADSLHCLIPAINGIGIETYILGTFDGGESWRKVYIELSRNERRRFPLLIGKSAFPAPNLAIVTADSGFILRSTDTGRTWEERRIVEIPAGGANTAGPISMLDTQYGILAWKLPRYDSNTATEFLMTTSDGGLTWDTLPTSPILPEWAAVYSIIETVAYVAPDHYVCVLNNYGPIFKIASTTDGGATWSYADKPLQGENKLQRTSLEFPDPQHGFLIGYDFANGRKSFVALTLDSGRTWEMLHHDSIGGTFGGMVSSSFRDSLNGIAGGGMVFRTTNGGRDWERDSLESVHPTSITALWVQVLGESRAIAANGDGEIFIWDATSSVENESTTSGFTVRAFPNPLASDENLQIEVAVSKPEGLRLSLFSSLGVELLKESEQPVEAGLHRTEIDLDTLPAGVYMLRVGFGESEWTERIVLVR